MALAIVHEIKFYKDFSLIKLILDLTTFSNMKHSGQSKASAKFFQNLSTKLG